MRLVCPNCEAKYEVPEDAIPETGRDVQCANCGHAWYQMRSRAAGAEAAAAPVVPPAPPPAPEPVVEPEPVPEVEVAALPPVVAEAEVIVPPEPEPVEEVIADAAETMPEPVVEAPVEVVGDVVEEVAASAEITAESVVAEASALSDPTLVEASVAEVVTGDVEEPVIEAAAAPVAGGVAETVVADAQVMSDAADGDDETAGPAPAVASAAAAYAVDESVLAILREEAAREAQARRAEAAKPLETQTDLGIDAAIPAAVKAPVTDVAAAVDLESEDKLATRRTRLPDVEEINSTLRPAETAQDGTETVEAMAPVIERRSSFRSGFLMVLTVAILGSALYGSADALAQAIPALAGPLKAYVGFVDSLRLHLDGLMQSATVAINGT